MATKNIYGSRLIGAFVSAAVVRLALEVPFFEFLLEPDNLADLIASAAAVGAGVYATVHKLLSRWWNPADTAVAPESAAAALHLTKDSHD